MRGFTASIGGRDIEIAATFGAAREISEKVADPIAIVREATLEEQIGAHIYKARFAFTVKNIPVILLAGARAAGSKMTLDEMQEACFNEGFLECKPHAFNLILMLTTPKTDEKPDAESESTEAGN